MRKLFLILVFSLYVGALTAQRAGDLYLNFSSDGYFIEDWEDIITQTFSLGILSDGCIIVPGTSCASGSVFDIIVSKLNNRGQIVPYGNSPNGLSHDLGLFDMVTSCAVLPGDTVLVAGSYSNDPSASYPFIMKLLPDGQIDENFGEDGIFYEESVGIFVKKIDVYEHEGSCYILLGGEKFDHTPLIMMVDSEGEIESSFGTDGIIEVSGLHGSVSDICIDNENEILYTCGYIEEGGGFLTRNSLPDGYWSTSFGMGGLLFFRPEENFSGTFNTLVFDPADNAITVMGNYPLPAGDEDIFAYRVSAENGDPDPSFGYHGISSLRSAGSDEYIKSAILQSDGKYYFGGYSDYNGTNDIFIGRINHNGLGDTTFGTSGLVLTGLGSNDLVFDIQLSEDENILYAAGFSGESDNSAITIAAYHTTSNSEPPIGLEINTSDVLCFYPNPTTGQVCVNTSLKGLKKVQVVDITGNEVYAATFAEESIDMNLDMLQPSIYFIRVTLPDKRVITDKMVKN